MDDQVSVAALRQEVGRFLGERGWTERHTPRNLAVSIAIEAAELMEHFQWLDDGAAVAYLDDAAARQEVSDELADVLIDCLTLANAADIDLSDAIRSKLSHNALRWPVDSSQ